MTSISRRISSDHPTVTIAVIDDDEQFLDLTAIILGDEGYRVILCPDSVAAFHVIAHEPLDLVVLDVRLETRSSGWEILQVLRSQSAHPRVPVIVCSAALDDIRARAALLHLWEVTVLHKPFNVADFIQRVTDALSPPVGTGAGDRRIG